MSFEPLSDPTILFFCLGFVGVFFGTRIELPEAIHRFLSYYLLLAIGFKGGVALSVSVPSSAMWLTFIVAIILSTIIPIWSFFVLRIKLDTDNSAAVAAAYGSVSAVTFITATSFLSKQGIEANGYMVAVLALMESPAIIVALLLHQFLHTEKKSHDMREIFRDSFLNPSVFLLLGSLFIGWIVGKQPNGMQTFIYDIFKGLLSLFLLGLGVEAASRLKSLKEDFAYLFIFAAISPIVNASIAYIFVKAFAIPVEDGFLLLVLAASASYIAVPAALKLAIPESNPAYYLGSALGVTFPINILFGLPLYWKMLNG
jgi:hypothetical protein